MRNLRKIVDELKGMFRPKELPYKKMYQAIRQMDQIDLRSSFATDEEWLKSFEERHGNEEEWIRKTRERDGRQRR